MSIEKSQCPAFKKEKEIRRLMSKNQCTYKRALFIILDKKSSETNSSQETIMPKIFDQVQSSNGDLHKYSRSYRDVTSNKNKVHIPTDEMLSDASNSSIESVILGDMTDDQDRKKKKKKKKSKKKRTMP